MNGERSHEYNDLYISFIISDGEANMTWGASSTLVEDGEVAGLVESVLDNSRNRLGNSLVDTT